MKIGELFALLELHAEKFVSGLNDAEAKARAAGGDIAGQFDNVAKKVTSATGGVTGITGKLKDVGKGMVLGAGIGAFNLLSQGVGLAISKLDEAHQAFLDDQVSAELLAGALQNNIPNWAGNTAGAEAYASAQAKLGFADDEVRASLGQLVGITHDLTAAQELNSLAQDIARAKNIDLAAATDIVTKAAQGQGRGLKGLGIDVTGLTTAEEFLAAAHANVDGASAAWAETNKGKLAVSNVAVGEAMEKVGGIIDQASQVLIPALAGAFVGLVDVLGQVWDATEPVRNVLGPILKIVFDGIANAIKNVSTQVQNVIRFIENLIKMAADAVDAVSEIPGVELVGDVAGNVGGAVGGVVGGIGDLIPKFASGTNSAPGGLSLVGERGPELVNLPGGTQVFPHGTGMGGNTVVQATFTANGVQNPEQFVRDSLQALRREVSRQSMSLA